MWKNELRRRGFNVDVGVIPVAERNAKGTVMRKQLEVLYQSTYSIPDWSARVR